MNVPVSFPYQGSKRKIAQAIMSYLPEHTKRLIEPFAGSAAVSLAAASENGNTHFYLNDIDQPLMALWEKIIHEPEVIARQYQELWHQQAGRRKEFYFDIRGQFNQTHRPDYLLYLLARCVKAAVRYNSAGEFNQSPDNRRKGTHPDTMRKRIEQTSQLLRGRTTLSAFDYRETLTDLEAGDVVYLDPPYQGVLGRDPRYLEGVAFEEFVDTLEMLNTMGIPYLLSYDGRTGKKTFGQTLPSHLGLSQHVINAGRSSQATLLGRKSITYESLYLSSALVQEIEMRSATYG